MRDNYCYSFNDDEDGRSYMTFPSNDESDAEDQTRRQQMIKEKLDKLLTESTGSSVCSDDTIGIDAKLFLAELKRYKSIVKDSGDHHKQEELRAKLKQLEQMQSEREHEYQEYKNVSDNRLKEMAEMLAKWKSIACSLQKKVDVLEKSSEDQQQKMISLEHDIVQGKKLCLSMYNELSKVCKEVEEHAELCPLSK